MNKRFFAFGCSFTHFYYPTWADIYSVNFDEYQNWAMTGAGNKYIFEALIKCDVINNFTPNDTVIVQWSSHQRYDRWNDEDDSWLTTGNIYNSSSYYPDDWVRQYFSMKGHIMHSLNFIHAAQELLNSRNINWYMTSMSDLTKTFSEPTFKDLWIDGKLPETTIFEKYPDFHIYKPILEKYKLRWKQNFSEFCEQTYNRDLTSHRDHPTPIMHLEWLVQNFAFSLDKDKYDHLMMWTNLAVNNDIAWQDIQAQFSKDKIFNNQTNRREAGLKYQDNQ